MYNRPFLMLPLPRVKTSLDVRTHMKMCLGLHVRFRANQSHFHMKGFAR